MVHMISVHVVGNKV